MKPPPKGDANDQLVAGTLPKDPRHSPHLRLVSGPREPGSHDIEDEQAAAAEEAKLGDADFRSRIATPYELMLAVYNRATRKDPEPERLSTLSSEVDRLTGGFRRRTTTILGARSNWGKTKYTVALWVLCALRGLRPLIIGGEDSKRLYEQRYSCQRANIGAMAVRDNTLSDSEMGSLLYAINGATDDERRVPMFLSAIGKPIEWAMKAAECLWAEWGYDFIVLDHLQQFKTARQDLNRDGYSRVSHVGEMFDTFIKTVGGEGETGPAGLILSQFKQSLPDEEWPKRGDLRYAGAVAERADMILLGHAVAAEETQAERMLRPEGSQPPLQRLLKVDKARDGVLGGKVALAWDSPTATFGLDEGT